MQTHKFFFSSLQHLPHKNKKTPNEAFYRGCIHLTVFIILNIIVVILVIMEGAYTPVVRK